MTTELETAQPEQATELAEPYRMSDDELKQFVLNVLDNEVFTSAQVDDGSLLGMVFMPLAFGAFEKNSEQYVNKIGVLWEHLSKAGPRSVNGYPIFFSMHVMHVEDWQRARMVLKAEFERRAALKV